MSVLRKKIVHRKLWTSLLDQASN